MQITYQLLPYRLHGHPVLHGIEKRIMVEGQDTPWTNGDYTSACKTQIKGLESGKTYQLRFRAIGNNRLVSPWSAVSDLLVS